VRVANAVPQLAAGPWNYSIIIAAGGVGTLMRVVEVDAIKRYRRTGLISAPIVAMMMWIA